MSWLQRVNLRRWLITLMISTSKTSVISTRLHSTTSYKTTLFNMQFLQREISFRWCIWSLCLNNATLPFRWQLLFNSCLKFSPGIYQQGILVQLWRTWNGVTTLHISTHKIYDQDIQICVPELQHWKPLHPLWWTCLYALYTTLSSH